MIRHFLQARENGSKVFFVGNGGSASTASHFANDLAICTQSKTIPFRAISLADNQAIMTTIANDFGYADMFARQIDTLYSDGDLLVAISVSGNSPNVIKAVEYVRSRGGTTIGLTGSDGGKLRGLVDLLIAVPADKGEYGPVEDIHVIVNHVIGTYLMYTCRNEYNELNERESTQISAQGPPAVYW